MDEEQFLAAIQGKTEQRDVSVREVNGGYVLTGIRRFLVPSTQAVVLQQNVENVCTGNTDAASAVANFLADGKF